MAKPIKATPILYNEEARAFIRRTEANNNKKASHEAIKAIKEGASRLQAMFVTR